MRVGLSRHWNWRRSNRMIQFHTHHSRFASEGEGFKSGRQEGRKPGHFFSRLPAFQIPWLQRAFGGLDRSTRFFRSLGRHATAALVLLEVTAFAADTRLADAVEESDRAAIATLLKNPSDVNAS